MGENPINKFDMKESIVVTNAHAAEAAANAGAQMTVSHHGRAAEVPAALGCPAQMACMGSGQVPGPMSL